MVTKDRNQARPKGAHFNPRRRPYTLTVNDTLKEADIEKAMNLLTDWVDKRRAQAADEN